MNDWRPMPDGARGAASTPGRAPSSAAIGAARLGSVPPYSFSSANSAASDTTRSIIIFRTLAFRTAMNARNN